MSGISAMIQRSDGSKIVWFSVWEGACDHIRRIDYVCTCVYMYVCTDVCVCVAGADYVSTPVDLTFNAGVTMQCFNVSIIDDDDYEFDEEFFVNLTTTDTQVTFSPSFSVVVITDLDSM